MKQKMCDYISSQQSPSIFKPYERKYKRIMYSRMLLEDFSSWFSSEFTPIELRSGINRNKFYQVIPEDDELNKLIRFNHTRDFDYNFDELLKKIMYYLLVNGRTYAEIVSLTDQNNVVRGIELICVPAKHPRKIRNTYAFSAKNNKGEQIHFYISRPQLIIFDLKDLGFDRNYFRRQFARLSKYELTDAQKLMLHPRMQKIFDFTEYTKTMDLRFLKDTLPIHWLGRKYDNEHLSESYLLYRKMKYKMLRYKFLQYILHQINTQLEYFKTEWKFEGHITTLASVSPYEDAFSQYQRGQLNTSQLGDILIKNRTMAEVKSQEQLDDTPLAT